MLPSQQHNQPVIEIRLSKRQFGDALAPREVLIDGEHRATFKPIRGTRRLKLHLLHGEAACIAPSSDSWPKYYFSGSLETAELTEVADAALQEGAIPSLEAQDQAERDRGREEDQQRFEAKCRAAGVRSHRALLALLPKDFDDHPQDFAPEWHEAAAAIRDVTGS